MSSDNKKILLSGNEAIALGAWQAGVKVASGYPGTPSTEILENLVSYEGVYTEWAPNEKVALEVAIGASFAGARALATMKHVGLNVAADPLFTAAYTGVRGGLVVIVADDPDMHSSQNEQDSRNYAYAAKVPMVEPSDSAEARDFLMAAYDLSEKFDTPVLYRSATRLAHVKGLLDKGAKLQIKTAPSIQKMPQKFVMLPGHARLRRVELEKRMTAMREFTETTPLNRIEWGDDDKARGFITSGVAYQYVREVFPDAPVLKLGMAWPLPEKLIKDFASKVGEVIVVEELDPFIETHVKAMGVACKGKSMVSPIGELSPQALRKSIKGEASLAVFENVPVPMRPPNLCPGCPHRGLFYALSKLGVFVSGDIGCYTLGALKPLSAMDTCVCMGASLSIALGMEKALGAVEAQGKIVVVIGDSTFVHSGITPLIDIVYNKGCSTVIILDNSITAMTGHQNNPASGATLMGEPANAIDLGKLCEAIGVRSVRTVNPHDIEPTMKVIKEELERAEPSVIIAKAPCVLLPEVCKLKVTPYQTVISACKGCRACIGLGCPAISWVPLAPEEAVKMGYKEKQKGHSLIDVNLCNGCGQCFRVCKFGAIELKGGAK